MVVKIKINEDTFATLLAGLYVTYHDAEAYAIPSYVWLALAEALSPYLDGWNYPVQSLESWIANYLLITAKEVCSPEELAEFQKNSIYIEILNGNVTLVATAPIIWEENYDG